MLVGRQGLLIWALGLFVPSRTSSSVRNCASFPRQPFWAVTRAWPGRLSRSVTPWLMHLPALASRLAAGLPSLRAIKSRTSDVDQIASEIHHPSQPSWPRYPGRAIPVVTSSGLSQVGFIFQLETTRDDRVGLFSTLFYADQTFALMRTAFSSSLLQVTNAIPSASRS
jgi:hypothetical protein